MGKYDTGRVSVTNGSNIVTGVGTFWLKNILTGDSFMVEGVNIHYQVASVVSDIQLTLSSNWVGETLTYQSYKIARDFTQNYNIPEVGQGDGQWPFRITQALMAIDLNIKKMWDRAETKPTTTTTSTTSSTTTTSTTTTSTSSTSSTTTSTTSSTMTSTTTVTPPPCYWDDDWTGADHDPWDVAKWTDGSSATVEIYQNYGNIASSTPCSGDVTLGAVFSGEFDVRVHLIAAFATPGGPGLYSYAYLKFANGTGKWVRVGSYCTYAGPGAQTTGAFAKNDLGGTDWVPGEGYNTYIRMKRDASGDIRVFYLKNGLWEWDGNPDGEVIRSGVTGNGQISLGLDLIASGYYVHFDDFKILEGCP